jgi:hypothetical protein
VEKLKPHLKTVQIYIQITDGLGPATKDPEIEDVIKQDSQSRSQKPARTQPPQ